ncbi:hypothetical protein F7725_016660 [Dissostichus mawsoni]|uniref:Uncharacterized protein n=1 Tax=Dissostichus mawsoni TaxID=36200 RepID=A0A7J5Z557_DISMA|nr:hypothetical protein F7725_016660 [Dissostichus mawsoni]
MHRTAAIQDFSAKSSGKQQQHLPEIWERETETRREIVKKSLAAVMLNFSPVPPGCGAGLFSHDGPLGYGAQRSGPRIWAVILGGGPLSKAQIRWTYCKGPVICLIKISLRANLRLL